MTCASTVIALHIETAWAESTSPPRRQNSQIQIHRGLAYLRASSEHWNSGQGTLHMLEQVVAKTGLTLGDLNDRKVDFGSANPFTQRQNKAFEGSTGLVGSSGVSAANNVGVAWTDLPSPPGPLMGTTDVTYGIMAGDEGPEKYLKELLADNFLDFEGMQTWDEFV